MLNNTASYHALDTVLLFVSQKPLQILTTAAFLNRTSSISLRSIVPRPARRSAAAVLPSCWPFFSFAVWSSWSTASWEPLPIFYPCLMYWRARHSWEINPLSRPNHSRISCPSKRTTRVHWKSRLLVHCGNTCGARFLLCMRYL